MPTWEQLEAGVAARIQDAAAKLSTGDRTLLIQQAIQQRYSKDRPREIAPDMTGDGTAFLTLPSTYEDGFSVIRGLEYPLAAIPPTMLEDGDWQLYRSSAGLKVMLRSAKPTASESVRITFTARHAADGTTVRACDFEAVCDYAGSLCCDGLAATYAQTGDPALLADSVNYRTKGQDYLGLAKKLRARYFEFMGNDPEAAPASAGPAISVGELDQELAAGVDRLTHPASSR